MPFSKPNSKELATLVRDLRSSDRAALAKAITIVESVSTDHEASAGKILEACLPHTGNSIRIGITGSPGVGKSTFINAFGYYLIREKGKRVAVLAIDPSSAVSQGSILGDKTRMQDLASSPNAYIRPSPSGGDLGGVAARTRESILICEAAGYDVILVETVGVGQSETAVHQMVDFFLLLILPGAGDDLQGIKRGIVEMADLIAVTKADGENIKNAEKALGFYKGALQLSHSHRSGWKVDIRTVSALERTGLKEVWHAIENFEKTQRETESWDTNRAHQNEKWFDAHVDSIGRRYIQSAPQFAILKSQVIDDVKRGKRHPLLAAEEVVREIVKK